VACYVLDTNLYITADRDEAWAEGLARFVSAYLPSVHFHGVVAQELLAGAIDARRERLVTESLITPFAKRGRVVAPSFASWTRAGQIVSKLIQRKLMSPGGVKPSFLNDCVLAASCRLEGITLITLNRSDFELIRRVEPVEVADPWPMN
jgi:predicted nucleic acid-binding protein